MKDYKLTKEELESLPRELRPSGHFRPMHLYSVPQVQHLCRQKHGALPEGIAGVAE
jgi:hypothetical protein